MLKQIAGGSKGAFLLLAQPSLSRKERSMARFMILILFGLVLSACSVPSAQASLETTQTAIARQASELEPTPKPLPFPLCQTPPTPPIATSNTLHPPTLIH